jgi:hypothetical protein
MKLNLKVSKIKNEEIYRDFARIPEMHRGGIAEGSLCRITYNQRSVYLAIRGLQDETEAVLKLDGITKDKLGVDNDCTYEFHIEELNALCQLFVTWHATDPFNRQALRLGILGFCLGAVGLVLGLISLFK